MPDPEPSPPQATPVGDAEGAAQLPPRAPWPDGPPSGGGSSDTPPSVDPEPARGTLAALLALLDLHEAPEIGPDTFVGQSERQAWSRVYGGQVLAQALVAAQRTVDPAGRDRPVHSLHGYFLRAGDDTEPITFEVQRLRDGRSFTVRRVNAMQFGKVILTMSASFQLPSPGIRHALTMPPAPDPDSLPSLHERYQDVASAGEIRSLRRRPVHLRHVTAPPYLTASPERQAAAQLWMRTVGDIPGAWDTPAIHAAVLTYASDYAMFEPILRRHGLHYGQPGVNLASLDHVIWFHRPVRIDDWVLVDLNSPSASGARGLGLAEMYSQDGTLVATVGQEGMVRTSDEVTRSTQP